MTFSKFPKLTFWRVVLVLILAAGFYSTLLRFAKGLGAATNLSDQFPWGLWIGFDVLCGVGLAAGGFTLAAIVYVFHIERFHPVLRPSILTAFLGYALVAVALLYDLGKPYNIWHPLVMWNPHSVMFEVAWCVMLYLTVLALEFSPAVLERFQLHKPLRVIKAVTIPLVIVGVLLSTLHQSSLGSLFLIVPSKLHPYWYSPLLPVFFFISAVGVGMAMVIFESNLSSRAFGREIEMPLLEVLGRAMAVVLAIYGVLKFQDLWGRGALSHLREPSTETVLFLLEITLGLLIPLPLLLFRKVREDRDGLFGVAVLVITGFLLNRLNVSITGLETSSGVHYFPRWTEVAVTLSIVGVGFLLFSLAVRYLNVMEPVSGHRARDTGYGTRDTGYGVRDTGHGTRDAGIATRA
ncbi:MAG TPA: Ni/Fe-hydrogenase cytochrome b subunit [Terriglobia bacterium]|nr:Ni/Fe-hydrogenase cytochrome b subunit [Terriglobia bacterium]